MLSQVLGDEPALCDNNFWAAIYGFNADDGRFAEGVDGFELGGGEVSLWVAVEDFEIVGETELGEEPEDALGAGFLEPGGC
ncbi:hypothetical protein V495_03292 [Pseudogymnoascus sp. VKM F-4514 (FW-929)]|nr:hypothetical protein V495_03292 [Pseudogymnoascus sp. VKM F-4514 (FW-929)]